jgi:hypothetical protein
VRRDHEEFDTRVLFIVQKTSQAAVNMIEFLLGHPLGLFKIHDILMCRRGNNGDFFQAYQATKILQDGIAHLHTAEDDLANEADSMIEGIRANCNVKVSADVEYLFRQRLFTLAVQDTHVLTE